MIACKLAHLAGETDAAIGQQDFGLADATGIKDDLAGRGIAGVVLIRTPKSRSPSGTQTASPLQRTWIAWLSNGMALRNAATVLGASFSSKRA